jgi:transposase
MRVLMMSTRQRGRVSKYTDDFKRKLVAESSADGVSVPMVAQRQGVPENRIYAWRGDPRFQPDDTDAPAFTPVEIADADIVDTPASSGTSILPVPSISFSVAPLFSIPTGAGSYPSNVMNREQQTFTMSSREIAYLCEKQHKNVLRDIEKML